MSSKLPNALILFLYPSSLNSRHFLLSPDRLKYSSSPLQEIKLVLFASHFLAKELGRQLDGWLQVANVAHRPARAIIAP